MFRRIVDNLLKYILTISLIIIGLSGYTQADKVKLANEYYLQGEFEKAESMFKSLSRNNSNIQSIHANYLSLLINDSNWKEAEKYLDRVLKSFPSNISYQVDRLFLYATIPDLKKKEDYQKDLLNRYKDKQYPMSSIGQQLVAKQLLDDAIEFLLAARKVSGSGHTYALELAAVYRLQDEKSDMMDEYINYAMMNPGNVNYIKNVFQTLLTEDGDLDLLERSLFEKSKRSPGNNTYSELLVWTALQRRDFYGAFIQARAIDKRKKTNGSECMKIGRIAMDNSAWEDAVEIYEYIIEEYGDERYYSRARQLLIQSKEGMVKSTYPVDISKIRELTLDYTMFYREIGPNVLTMEALRNKALLHAFYLDEKDSAISILNGIIRTPRIKPDLISKCKISLGDIYLLIGEPWESTLLYSQVEKANKYSPVGYNAKLKNAKLQYYSGNFQLSKSHLDVLKRATTKEISNDAIGLSLLINNNTVFDTTTEIMQSYANAELMIFQNKFDSANQILEQLYNENPNHTIADETLWLLADLDLKKGNYEQAVSNLDIIISNHSYDVLADDAYFKKAEIFEQYLNDEEQAKILYRDFITNHPGSMFAAEARKRFRQLRGDQIN
ncbi:MAG: tetratricopeptide repeat protein [Cyclobacteriaceae bacterium]